MKIITVSREFGSGGRELGKRLADTMGFEYFDKEIIAAIAANKNMDENYVETILENRTWRNAALHFRSSFSGAGMLDMLHTNLLLEQKQVIEAIAASGKDCVIVGRNADILLQEYAPFNMFVCADMPAKIQRSLERAGDGEKLSHKEMERTIRAIDKNRAQSRQIITDSQWGDRSAYHLTVNTTGWNIKELVPAVAGFIQHWFGRTEK